MMFGGPLQGLGAVEAAEVVVGMHHSSHRHRATTTAKATATTASSSTAGSSTASAAPPQPPLEEEQEAQAQEEQRARQLDFALAQLASTMQILEDTFDRAVPNPGSATEDELRQMLKSYKRASLRLHPDKGGDPETYAI